MRCKNCAKHVIAEGKSAFLDCTINLSPIEGAISCEKVRSRMSEARWNFVSTGNVCVGCLTWYRTKNVVLTYFCGRLSFPMRKLSSPLYDLTLTFYHNDMVMVKRGFFFFNKSVGWQVVCM